MPKLSIVVPVYNVEAYIRECLDSVVRSEGDFEVIVVDDCSPDNSARIAEEFVERDQRVRLIRSEANVGLGPARNIGLDEAGGDYVMFLDSDDSLLPGSIGAIIGRAETSGADIVIFDYQRTYWNNTATRNVLATSTFHNSRGVTTLSKRPDLLRLLNVAWNKAYRRDFLIETGIRFPPGYYEDIPFTYPILGLAESIALLDRVCINYRQRRQGSILRSASTRHFEILEQIDRVFEIVDRHPELDRWRPQIWERCASHVVTILAHGEKRLPPSERQRFFSTASEILGRHRPDGHEIPDGARGTKIRLILANQYAVFTALKTVSRTRIAARDQVRKVWAHQSVRDTVHKGLARLPVDPKIAVYTSLWNRAPSGNPLAIYEACRELAPDVHGVWIVRRGDRALVPKGFDVVTPDSRRHIELMARAKFFVNDVNFPNWWIKRPDQRHLQTQHGTPLKFMGLDLQRYPIAANGMSFGALMERVDKWDYNLSSNSFSTEAWERAFPSDYETLEYGYPRNDVLVNASAEACRRARERVGVPADARVILYMPTHRDGVKGLKLGLDLAELSSQLDESATIIVRGHYFYSTTAKVQALQASGSIVDASNYSRVEDLYLASDVLITDYSSAMFDYANLGRPIIVHAYDWNNYRRNRGTYFDITIDAPGQVTTTLPELASVLNSGAERNESAQARLSRFQSTFCEFDDGHAARRVVERLFLDQDVAPPDSLHGEPAPLRSWARDRSG